MKISCQLNVYLIFGDRHWLRKHNPINCLTIRRRGQRAMIRIIRIRCDWQKICKVSITENKMHRSTAFVDFIKSFGKCEYRLVLRRDLNAEQRKKEREKKMQKK